MWPQTREREFFIDNILVRIHFIIVVIRWTGLAPWEFEFPLTRCNVASCSSYGAARVPFLFFFFTTLDTGPRRLSSLELGDKKVYEP